MKKSVADLIFGLEKQAILFLKDIKYMEIPDKILLL
jgi:hypothetical protein